MVKCWSSHRSGFPFLAWRIFYCQVAVDFAVIFFPSPVQSKTGAHRGKNQSGRDRGGGLFM